MKRIGILGGTFNPPHKGHIALAMAAKREFALDEIIFMPTGNPPHKEIEGEAGKQDRYRMIQLAISGIKKFKVSRLEMDRPGFSYAVETFFILKRKMRHRAKLFYIMGLDSINEILSWKQPLELFKMCEFIVGTRPGTKIRTFKRLVKFPPLMKEVDKIHLIELKEDISSSVIRKKIGGGRPVGSVVPGKVLSYIKKKGLYK